jgi:AraC-like DNA-binding protein
MTPDAKHMTAGRRGSLAGPTVSAGFARGLLELAVARGAPRAALLDAAGLTAVALKDQDARAPFAAYVALMRAGKALSGDAALGLHYGEMVDISEVSIVGLIGQASATAMDAFQQLNRYVPLIVETENQDGGDRFRMQPRDGGFWLVDARSNPNAFPELTESAFAQLVCGPRRFGPGPKLLAAHFTHSDPGYRAEYERIFRCPVTFGADWNAMRIDPAWAAAQVQQLPRYAFGVLAEHAEALLAELESSKSVRGRVERLLLPVLHKGAAGMEAVAGDMALSRQTLFRKLKAEGVTFEQVLDALRERLALDYLRAGKVSVNETAYLVGFSDPAAFSRAFKRWTGVGPKAWRERQAGG